MGPQGKSRRPPGEITWAPRVQLYLAFYGSAKLRIKQTEDVAYILEESVVTYTQSIIDAAAKENADFHS